MRECERKPVAHRPHLPGIVGCGRDPDAPLGGWGMGKGPSMHSERTTLLAARPVPPVCMRESGLAKPVVDLRAPVSVFA